jgi:CHASE3 domain sensor protein
LVKSRTPLTIALLAAGFLALIVIVVATFWLGQRAQQYALEVTHVRELRLSAVELRDALLTAESGQRGFLFSGNEIYLGPFDSAKAAARREAGELERDLLRYPQLQPMISQLGRLVETKIAEMEDTIAFKRAGNDQQTMDLFLSNRGKALMDQTNVFVIGLTMDILPKALNAEYLPQYEADLADPGAVYAEPVRRDSYLRMYGNICYDTRQNYLNFPWSSERG